LECEAAMRFQHHKLNYKTEDVWTNPPERYSI
jgi:hypothetical protein